MSENKKSSLSPRLEHFIKGLFFILFALVISLNVGKVGRTLAFPFIYFLGAASYIVLAFIFVCGVYNIIFGKNLKIKFKTIVLGLIALSIGAALVMSSVLMTRGGHTFADGVKNNVTSLNGELARYYQQGFLNLFEQGSYWNTGLIGILIGSLIGNDSVVLTLGILFAVLGFVLIVARPIIYLLKHHEKKEKKVEPEEEEEEEEVVPEEIVPIFVPEPKEEITELPYGYEVEDIVPEFDPHSNASLDDSFSNKRGEVSSINEFEKLQFRRNDEPVLNEIVPDVSRQPANTYEEVEIENEDYEDPDIPHYEDVYLDENYVELTNNTPAPAPVKEEVVEAPTPAPATAPANPFYEAPAPAVETPKKRERVNWVPPSSDLLATYEVSAAQEANEKAAQDRLVAINNVFANFRIGAKCTGYTIGSSVTRFHIEYEANVSSRVVEKYVTDIAIQLGGLNVRFTPIVEGEVFSGLEIPNVETTTVSFKEVFESLPDVKKHPMAVAFGKNISGKVVAADFDEFPHLLVAGTTGSGKSIYTHSILATLIMRLSPDDLKLVLVDPKRVEMTKYRDMPHLLCPIITEADKAKVALSKLVDEMNDRYQKFSDLEECSNIKQYNEWAKENGVDPLPYIVVMIDEYADLVDNCKEISQPVVSIAQKARAAGIHMSIATQRPSTNIITGVIKGNLPTHVALMTSSPVDSVTIINEGGAEKLLGKGDMLVQSPLVSRVGVTRLQGCFINNREINHIVGYLKEHYETHYDENYLDLVDHSKEVATQKVLSGEVEKEADAAEEAKYQSIKEWVMSQQFVSMSKIQRECGVGFNRAGRFFNRLQKEGVVSTEQDGATKGCKVLVHDDFYSEDVGVNSDELTRY